MLALLADIGGTNARFCVMDITTGHTHAAETYATERHAGFADCLRHFLASVDAPAFDAMVVAAAGPKKKGVITLTNLGWQIDEATFAALAGTPRVRLLNDFEALAYAIPSLAPSAFENLGHGPTAPVETGPIALIGPGTGLGVSGLLPASGSLPERAIAGEGGHISFAAESDREWQIISHLRGRFGHVSAERIASGRGLVETYQSICALNGVQAALNDGAAIAGSSDPAAAEAREMFALALGSAAGSIALSLGAIGGVYVAGGIIPKWGEAFRADLFRARFDAKGRFESYMKAIPTRLITQEVPAFSGLARVAAQLTA